MHRKINSGRHESENPRTRAAGLITEVRFGELDGVIVDFRHPDLDPSEWTPRAYWYVWGGSEAHSKVLFPGEAKAGVECLRREYEAKAELEVFLAHPGDRVSVQAVLPQIKDRRFDHPHDSQKRLAFLQIERPCGEVVQVREPMSFYGVTQLRDGAPMEGFDNGLLRICRHAGHSDLDGPSRMQKPGFRPLWDEPLEEIAYYFAQHAHDGFWSAHAAAESDIGRGGLRAVANFGFMAGFLLGKIEARQAEKTAAKVHEAQQKATAARTRTDWLEKAKALWAEHPEYKRTRVAHLVAEGTDDDPRAIMRSLKSIDPHLPAG
jgi:hypothetical protein